MEIERYLRIPFTFNGDGWGGCNCWGLIVLAFREELGITLPLFDAIPSTSLREAARKIRERSAAWEMAADPQPFDVVGLRGASVANGRSFSVMSHVGLVVEGGQILHTEEDVGPVLLPISDPLISYRVVEFRRFAGGC